MSNSTHEAGVVDPDGTDAVQGTSWTCLHLRKITHVDGEVLRDAGRPYVTLHLGSWDATVRTSVFIHDPELLDRLIATLTEARAELVNQLLIDTPKAG